MDIDHVFSTVPSLEAAAEVTAALGFAPTRRGEHPGRGTANRLVVMPGCYWELLAVESPVAANAPFRELGLRGLALSTRDAEADRVGLGVESDPAVGFSRPVEADGDVREARFRTAALRPRLHASVFLCEHLTPELVWRPELMRHPNGATGVSGLDFVCADIRRAADTLAGLFSARPESDGSDMILAAGRVSLRILTPDRVRTVFPDAAAFRGREPEMVAIRFAGASPAASSGLVRRGPEGLYCPDPRLGGTVVAFGP